MEFPVYTRNGLTLTKGSGAKVWDSSGREYIDFYGGHAVAILGYGHPQLTAAIQKQTEDLIFQTNAVDLGIRTEACNAIARIAPEGLDSVLLMNSGAEANENALRLAFMRVPRTKAVAVKGAFHGRTAAAGALTDGNASWYAFPRAPFDVEWVPVDDIAALDRALSDKAAAFIYEPVQGVAGAVSLSAEFLKSAREMCTARGIVMIADEVQIGMGRAGDFFASSVVGVTPDLLTTAKGLGAGFPTAALIAPKGWAQELKPGSFGTTFGGGPVACAAICAVIEALGQPGFFENVRRISGRLRCEMPDHLVEHVSGSGLLLGLHCRRPAKEVRAELLAKGFLTGDAKDPSVVRLLPPLIIGDKEVDALLTALGELSA